MSHEEATATSPPPTTTTIEADFKRRLGDYARLGDVEGVKSLIHHLVRLDEPIHNKSKDTLLHIALSRNKLEVVHFLLNDKTIGQKPKFDKNNNKINDGSEKDNDHGVAMVNATNEQGMTPLMVAVVSSSRKRDTAILQRLLDLGADPLRRSHKQLKTALDMARDTGNDAAVRLLQQQQHHTPTVVASSPLTASMTLKNTQSSSSSSLKATQCPYCGVALKRKSRLDHVMHTLRNNCVDNLYLQQFLASPVCLPLTLEPNFHVITAKRHLRKEITESWSIVSAIQQQISPKSNDNNNKNTPNDLFVVDLCAGNSLTTCILGLLHPTTCRVVAVDRMSPTAVPHFTGNMSYHQADIFQDGFEETLRCSMVVQKHEKGVLVGMHLCGELSLRAIHLFHAIPAFQTIVLSPCCFPKHSKRNNKSSASKQDRKSGSARASQQLIDRLESLGQDDAEKYEVWSQYLCDELSRAGTAVSRQADPHILSDRNMVIVGTRNE